MAAMPAVRPRAAAWNARVAALEPSSQAAAIGNAKSGSVAPMNRAGELKPPHHMWYIAVTTA